MPLGGGTGLDLERIGPDLIFVEISILGSFVKIINLTLEMIVTNTL